MDGPGPGRGRSLGAEGAGPQAGPRPSQLLFARCAVCVPFVLEALQLSYCGAAGLK